MLWTDNMVHPEGRAEQVAWPSQWINFYYDPVNAATIEACVNYVCPVKGAREVMLDDRPGARQQPAHLPAAATWFTRLYQFRSTTATEETALGRGLHQGDGPLAAMRRAISFRSIAPYALLAPGLLFLAIFFVYPAIQMFLVSLWTGNITDGFQQTWNWGIYPEAFTRVLAADRALDRVRRAGDDPGLRARLPARLRDRVPGRRATRTCSCSWSSHRSSRASCCGRSRGRSSSSDDGIVLGPLKTARHHARLTSSSSATPAAVIAGITYNFLPFMTLPLYVALEKIDRRLLEAAEDLYAGPWRPRGTIVGPSSAACSGRSSASSWTTARCRSGSPGSIVGGIVGTWLISEAFIKVTLPLALPGVFAGSLLTFIPAVGDYINAELLGNPQTRMIGNVIQARYLQGDRLPDRARPCRSSSWPRSSSACSSTPGCWAPRSCV